MKYFLLFLLLLPACLAIENEYSVEVDAGLSDIVWDVFKQGYDIFLNHPKDDDNSTISLKNRILQHISNLNRTLVEVLDENLLRREQKAIIKESFTEILYLTSLPQTNQGCFRCIILAEVLLKYHKLIAKYNPTRIGAILCRFSKAQKIDIGCLNFFMSEFPTIDFILSHSENVTAKKICGLRFQNDCENNFWHIDLKIPKYNKESFSWNAQAKTTNNLKILHLTDIHLDPNYVENGLPDCDNVVCCRYNKIGHGESIPRTKQEAAPCGKYGQYASDTAPSVRWEDTPLVNDVSIDYIYYTGDMVDHARGDKTNEYILNVTRNVTDDILKIRDVPTFFVLGNHDSNPSGFFSPYQPVHESHQSEFDKLKTTWVYESLAKLWLKDDDAIKTFRTGGYYTISPRPGWRIIALNNNIVYTSQAWWILYDPSMMEIQLQWLVNTLEQAENNNEYVHILSHIPNNNNDLLKVWSENYQKIIERFSHIITGQFNGHTHFDQFQIFYESNTLNPINIAWNGGSATTFTFRNLNYRFYHLAQNYSVVDHETWIYNLTEADQNPSIKPRWFKEYSLSDYVKDASPNGMHEYAKRLYTNKTLAREYWDLQVKKGDVALEMGYVFYPIEDSLCDIVRTHAKDTNNCKEMEKLLNP